MVQQYLALRRPGRPKGAKDTKPRAKGERKSEVSSRTSLTPSAKGSLSLSNGLLNEIDGFSIDDKVGLDRDQNFSGSDSVSERQILQKIDPFHNDWPHW